MLPNQFATCPRFVGGSEFRYRGSEPVYAASATISSSVRFATTRLMNCAIQPENVVPAQDSLCPVEQLRVAASSGLERERCDPVRRSGRDVAEDVQHLLLPGDLIDARIPGRVELHVRRVSSVSDTAL